MVIGFAGSEAGGMTVLAKSSGFCVIEGLDWQPSGDPMASFAQV